MVPMKADFKTPKQKRVKVLTPYTRPSSSMKKYTERSRYIALIKVILASNLVVAILFISDLLNSENYAADDVSIQQWIYK